MTRLQVVVPLALGAVLAGWAGATGASVAGVGLIAAFGLGALFPRSAALAGALLLVPQLARPLVVGASDSAGLFALAVVGGLLATGFSALVAYGGAYTRQLVETARAARSG